MVAFLCSTVLYQAVLCWKLSREDTINAALGPRDARQWKGIGHTLMASVHSCPLAGIGKQTTTAER